MGDIKKMKTQNKRKVQESIKEQYAILNLQYNELKQQWKETDDALIEVLYFVDRGIIAQWFLELLRLRKQNHKRRER